MSRSTANSCNLNRGLSILLLLTLAFLPAGCDEDNPVDAATPYGELLESVGCKPVEESTDARQALGEECLEWDLRAGVLSVTHVNAAFNCCPETISAEVLINGTSITVIEEENGGECDCSCLFDLHIAIYDAVPDVYTVSISGPYSPEPLDTTIDLVAQPTGSYCEQREVYPWL